MAIPITTIRRRISREFIEEVNIAETKAIVQGFLQRLYFFSKFFQNVGKYGVNNWAMTVNLFVKINTPTTIISTPETTSIVW
jgi:hypothetical protein